jgi:hypothetical protein
MQLPAQSTSVPWQETSHDPLEHTEPDGQTLPHLPQLFGSDCVSRQVWPHSVVPPPHVSAQAPFEQTLPPLHALPHAPQLSGSVVVSTHPPEHAVLPVQISAPSAAVASDFGDDPFSQHVFVPAQ